MALISLQKVRPTIPKEPLKYAELKEDLIRMGCPALLQRHWGFRLDSTVAELTWEDRALPMEGTLRARPAQWSLMAWRKTYDFEDKGEGMATRREEFTKGHFVKRGSTKNGYPIKDCINERIRQVIAFLSPIFHPEKTYQGDSHLGQHHYRGI